MERLFYRPKDAAVVLSMSRTARRGGRKEERVRAGRSRLRWASARARLLGSAGRMWT